MSRKEVILKVLKVWRGTIENKIARSLLSIGTVCIIAAVGPNLILPIIFELLNQFLKTNFDTTVFNFNYIVFGVLLIVGISFCVGAIVFYQKTKKKKIIGKLLKIRHSSIESSNTSNTDKDYSDYLLEVVDIDQKLEMSSNTKEGIEKALYIQEKEGKKIIDFTNENGNNEVEYYGLAHIPLVVLLGYQIADKVSVNLHEWNQNKSQWEVIGSNKKSYHSLFFGKK